MKNGLEWVYGIHTAQALLEKRPEYITQAYLLNEHNNEKLHSLQHTLQHININFQFKTRPELDQLLDSKQHQGVALLCKPAQQQDLNHLKKIIKSKNQSQSLLLLVLDGITDPHNLGACIRSAEAAGVDALIIPKNRAVSLNSTARKVACGAAELLPVIGVTNLAQCLKYLKQQGVWIYGAAGEATANIYRTPLQGHLALVMGNEAQGLRQLTRELCDGLFKIPLYGHTNSLNVSVATGVCLFEAQRQRQAS